MAAVAELLRVRQQVIKVAAPSRRIGAVLVDKAERPRSV
jgi:hypothetical protein